MSLVWRGWLLLSPNVPQPTLRPENPPKHAVTGTVPLVHPARTSVLIRLQRTDRLTNAIKIIPLLVRAARFRGVVRGYCTRDLPSSPGRTCTIGVRLTVEGVVAFVTDALGFAGREVAQGEGDEEEGGEEGEGTHFDG